MDIQQALDILIKSALIANRRGAFELNESVVLGEAVAFLTKKEDGTNTGTGDDTSDTTDGGKKEETVRVESKKSSKKGDTR